MEILTSWLHFFQIFLIGFVIVLLTPLVFFVIKAIVNAVASFISFIRWGLKK